jgi:hypothetical protein
MSTEKKPNDRTAVTTTLIVLIGTIITAIFASPWITEYVKKDSPPKPSPTASPSPSPNPDNVPPLPLTEVFPQVGEGDEFLYINEDKSDSLKKQFVNDEDCRHSGPYALKHTYRFTGGGNGGWGVSWRNTSAGSFDASGFTLLSLWVKGGLAGKERFQVGLKDRRGRETKIESDSLVVSISNWTRIAIPLNKFRDVDLRSIENINFGFNSNHGSGSICIDDVAFVK